jgi:PAS domain S-box-containing protein
MAEYARKRLQGEEAPAVYELTGIHRDGREIPIEASISTFISNGKVYIVAAQRDITKRKERQEALLRQKTELRVLFDLMPALIWFKDTENGILRVNQHVAESIGKSVEEIEGKPSFEIYPQTAAKYHRDDLEVIHSGKPKLGIVEILEDKDGNKLWVQTDKVPYRNEHGEVIGIIVVARDITESKQLEDELRQSEASLAKAQRLAHIGSWEWDIQNNRVFWSDEIYRMLDLSKTQIEASSESFLSAIHPEDLQVVQSALDAALRQGAPYNVEHRIITQSGGERVVCELGEMTFDESGKPVRMTGTMQDISERKLSEEALRQAEAKYRSMVESLPAIVYLAQPDPPYSPIYISPNIKEFGYSAEEWFSRPDMWVNLLHDEDRERVLAATKNAMSQGLETDLEYRIVSRDGTIHWVHDKGRFISDEQGNKISWQGVVLEITKTKELEEQLRQAQKLESVGRLSGGIAHDFNNMLTAINGFSELTLRRLKADDPLRHNIEEIRKAGQRSAVLTRQLLAFSRQQILQPVVLDLNEMITDTIKLLQRLIGEDVQLVAALNPMSGLVKVDPGQLSQIIVNLVVNARDAMPQGGKLTIETANVSLDPAYARQHAGVLPGAYVMLSVSYTGTGMSAETQRHIFEPFFTTKEIGKGTGLGLATVYGIVKQSGGNIWLYSEEGVGTTFKVYLPRVLEPAEAVELKHIPDELLKGTETILLVEDEAMVRSLTRQILEEFGYTILAARNGVEAVSICEEQGSEIDLLLTDVVMPEMGGRELAERFAPLYPQMRILFTSGYTDDAVVRHGVIAAGTNFIQKPFTPQGLMRKVREVLDAPHGS